jgi:uncharacterized protein YndB with AHSA1/START domain
MTDTITTDSEGIAITRTFDAPREAVFDAWTTPASFAAWFGGTEAAVPVGTCSIDARVGGTWTATMVLPDGNEIHWDGEFREVVYPERLVLTMRDRTGPEFELLTVEFRDLDGGTEMRFRQTGGNIDATGYEQAGAGWMAFFDTMELGLPSA